MCYIAHMCNIVYSEFEMQSPKDKTEGIIWKATLAAVALGVVITALLLAATSSESYSTLYLKPNSYSNYVSGKTVSFTYGTESFENRKTDYTLKVFLGSVQVAQKDFSINGKGDIAEDTISFEVPPKTEFPINVLITLDTSQQAYSTHFWLKGRK